MSGHEQAVRADRRGTSARPFDYQIIEDETAVPTSNVLCDGCGVYVASVDTDLAAGLTIYFCRDCLRRMRATLKAAEKALPMIQKVRP